MKKEEKREFDKPMSMAIYKDSNDSVWDTLKETNKKNLPDIQKQMKAFGYSNGEIEEFLKTKSASKKKDKIDEIKEDLYIRHKLRYRLLMDHLRDSNLLVTLDNMRAEDQHLIESLTKLGEIAPVAQGPNNLIQSLGIEQFVYSAYKTDTGKAPVLKEAPPLNEAIPDDDIGSETSCGTD